MPSANTLYSSPDLYDLFSTGVPGDTGYFARLAAGAGRVLELACGTGRTLIPMARAGAKVTGIELAPDMFKACRDKVAAAGLERKVTLHRGDMRRFALKQTFPLVVIPYRAFQHLLDVRDQRACLECCREHLTRQGRLVINLFDPNLNILAANLTHHGSAARNVGSVKTPDGGRITALATRVPCPEEQYVVEDWVFEKFDRQGNSQWRKSRVFSLRYFFRYEMEHLFELCGLRVEKLEGGFQGQPYRHGGEQVWTVRR
ncbi:MAG: class I SAM-dependent methyltransferase [Planctomycetes bacterium]|jgi:SAM-dependent methyltransferase|nr:class I SAM-dependent methyltransferase [Planctomycetota bacterium]MCL4731773.1 class I SAM-dependent methyltransferase [Planctomycetota bacterium]